MFFWKEYNDGVGRLFYLPMVQVVRDRPRAAIRRRVFAQVLQFLVDTLQRHCHTARLPAALCLPELFAVTTHTRRSAGLYYLPGYPYLSLWWEPFPDIGFVNLSCREHKDRRSKT